MAIIFDNIIFGLQNRGGISTYWGELLRRAPADSHIIEHSQDLNNSAWLQIKNRFSNRTLANLNSRFDRYLPVMLPANIHRDPTQSKKHIVHSSYYRSIFGQCAKVQTVHDFIYEKYRQGPAQWVHSAQKRLACSNADIILCDSYSTKKDLLEFYGSHYESKTKVVFLAASEFFRKDSNASQIISEQPILDKISSKEQPYLLYVGTRRPDKNRPHSESYKGFEDAVRIAALCKTYSLISVGGEPWNQEDEKLIQEYKIKSRFSNLGAVSDQILKELYSSAFALLYPSRYEGFGLPVLEASGCECPVIARNSSSIPEVHGRKDFLLSSNDSDEIMEKIVQLESSEFREKLIKDCLAHALTFSWDRTWMETNAIYQGLT